MEPSIWKGAIAAVPFVDAVTTMADASIPLLQENGMSGETLELKNIMIICFHIHPTIK